MTSQFTRRVTNTNPAFDFVAAHFKCEANRYSPQNPDGFVNFGSAQNQMHADLLASRLASESASYEDTHYQSFSGTSDCRWAVADYLAGLASCEVSAESVVVGNGVISVLEALTVALLDEGESVLVPTPVFPGLVNAISLRSRAKVEFLHTNPAENFRLSAATVEARLDRLEFEGKRVRAILLCSPGNPVGQVFSTEELKEIMSVAELYGCSLIVDEIYAGSIFQGHKFTSALTLQNENVYVLGGLSKDFGLAGYATGWLHSKNKAVLTAVAKQSHFFRLPAPMQRTIESMLATSWRSAYLQQHRKLLTRTANITRQELEVDGIVATPAEAGLCLWLDLRRFIRTADQTGELQLYQHLLEDYRVHVSPGSGFHTDWFGFFRICFSQPTDLLLEGLSRLTSGLAAYARAPSSTRSEKFQKSA